MFALTACTRLNLILDKYTCECLVVDVRVKVGVGEEFGLVQVSLGFYRSTVYLQLDRHLRTTS